MEWLLCGVLALLAIKSTVGVDIDKKCYADIAFVVDSSSSIHESDFKIQKAFIENLVRYFDVGPKDVQFAAVSFNSYVYDEFKFNTNADQASVIEDVDDIRYRAGLATRTYKAIERMRDFLFASNNGARDDAEHVGIILTDGTTNPGRIDGLSSNQGKAKTQEEAKSARNDNITLFAIGIGPKVNMAELNGIATDPDDKFVITVANYSELDKEGVKKALFNRVCSLVNIPAPIAPTTTPTIPQGEDPKEVCQGKPADIFFILDESSSIHTPKNFQLELSFVKQVVDYLDVGDDLTHVGLITFSSNASMRFKLDDFTTKDEVKTAVNKTKWNGGNTYTDKALTLLLDEGFTVRNGARKGVAQVGIIVTDGNSTDPYKTRKQAAQVISKGIYMFAIGVGAVYRPELDILASDPSSEFVFTVDTLDALETIKRLLAYRVCKEKPTESMEEICRQQVADVAFILDSSADIGQSNFDELIDFIDKVVSNFDIGSDNTRVGLITFADAPKIEFNLDSYTKPAEVEQGLSNVRFTSGQRNTDLAIQMMTNQIFSDSLERKDVPRIGIVITGGYPQGITKTHEMAAEAKKKGIHMFAIGVGKKVGSDQLEDIAADNYYMVDDFSELDSILRVLTTSVCKEGKKKSDFESKELEQEREMDIETMREIEQERDMLNERMREREQEREMENEMMREIAQERGMDNERREEIETLIDILRRGG